MKGPANPLAALIAKQRTAVSAAAVAGDGAERRRLAKTADTLTKHLARWVPDDIPDAIRLLQWGGAKPPPRLIKSVVTGLRAIATRNTDPHRRRPYARPLSLVDRGRDPPLGRPGQG
jgi:hypothetical protein